MTAHKALTSRQDVFARLVAHGVPVGQAAMEAGYNDPSQGSRTIRLPQVAAQIDVIRRQVAQGLSAQVTGTLAEVVGVIRREVVTSQDPDYALSAARALGLPTYVAADLRAQAEAADLSHLTGAALDAELDGLLDGVAVTAVEGCAFLLRRHGHHDAAALLDGQAARIRSDGLAAVRVA